MDFKLLILCLIGAFVLLYVLSRQKKREETVRREIAHSVPVRRMSEVSGTPESRSRDLDRMERLQGRPVSPQSAPDTSAIDIPPLLILANSQGDDGGNRHHDRGHDHIHHADRSTMSDSSDSGNNDSGDSGGDGGGGGSD